MDKLTKTKTNTKNTKTNTKHTNTHKTKHTNTHKTKNRRYKLKTKKQYGSSILNTLSSHVYSKSKHNITKKATPSVNPLDSFLFNKNKKNLPGNPTDLAFLTLYYNYKSPKEFILNSNTLYDNDKIFTAPHIQINSDGHFLVVLILSSTKPQLLWACDFKWRSKNKTHITYTLPKHADGTIFNILFKVYKYPNNIKKTFVLKNSISISRRKAYRRLNKYLKLNNMSNSYVPAGSKQIKVRQVKDNKITEIFTLLS
jgi:hypothetical protein